MAAEEKKVSTVTAGGGVAANGYLRKRLQEECANLLTEFFSSLRQKQKEEKENKKLAMQAQDNEENTNGEIS